MATISPIRPTMRHVLFPASTDNSIAAIATSDFDKYLINHT